MRSSVIGWIATVTVVAIPLTAGAATLTTPLMPADLDRNVFCLVTNVGTRPAEVTITGKDAAGATRTPVSGSCPLVLDAGKTCVQDYGNGIPVWCSFQVKGTVKAAINVVEFGSGNVVSSLPATK